MFTLRSIINKTPSSFFPDIDECSGEHKCDVNAVCNDTKGSYNCICKEGYYGDGRNCRGNPLITLILFNTSISSSYRLTEKVFGVLFQTSTSVLQDISVMSMPCVIVLKNHTIALVRKGIKEMDEIALVIL